MSKSKKINNELSAISRYIGLKYAKYTLLVLLALVYYPMRVMPGYIFIVTFLVPILFSMLTTVSSNGEIAADNLTMSYTAEKYHFTKLRYSSEKFGSVFTLLLLFLWQINIYRYDTYQMPFQIVPTFLIFVYILTRIITCIYFKYKIKHNLAHLNI